MLLNWHLLAPLQNDLGTGGLVVRYRPPPLAGRRYLPGPRATTCTLLIDGVTTTRVGAYSRASASTVSNVPYTLLPHFHRLPPARGAYMYPRALEERHNHHHHNTGTRHALAHMSWDRPLLEVEASPPLVWLGRCRRLGVGTGAAK